MAKKRSASQTPKRKAKDDRPPVNKRDDDLSDRLPPDLRKEIDKLAAASPKRVEIDLSSLRMVDSSGVGAIVSLYKRVRGSGGEVVVIGLRDQPLAIFRLLRLDRVMLNADSRTPPPAQKSKSRH